MTRPSFTHRPTLRIEQIVLVVLAYLLVVVNTPWWSAALRGRDPLAPGSWLLAAGALVALVSLHFIVVVSLCLRRMAKPLLSAMTITSAASIYYIQTFSVVLDPTMIQNVLSTDVRETRDLLSVRMLGSTLTLSALPLLFLARVRIAVLPWKQELGVRFVSILAALAVAAGSLLLIGRDLTPFMRTEPTARYLITPGNLIYGLVVNAVGSAHDVAGPKRPIGLDARRLPDWGVTGVARSRPRVLVFVLGETARAQSFSLFGYLRETNPQLAARDVVAFQNVRSCGTSTAVSVPCLFSVFGRERYDERAIRRSEGLLDVLAHAGIEVKWRDNQSGCQGVCQGAGIVDVKLDRAYAPDLCKGEDCLDEILLRRLIEDLDEVQSDTFIVLHMMGSHGPAYYRRYPPRFRRFVPDCATAELRQCSREAIVNTYDNGILYTDFVLSGIIDELGRRTGRVDSATVYVSDHGESLGEGGYIYTDFPTQSRQRSRPRFRSSPGYRTAGDARAASTCRAPAPPPFPIFLTTTSFTRFLACLMSARIYFARSATFFAPVAERRAAGGARRPAPVEWAKHRPSRISDSFEHPPHVDARAG